MVFVLVRHKVADFDKWKPAFDEHGKTRKKSGSKGAKVYKSKDNPKEMIILMEWDNIENAKKFAGSQDLKDTMTKAGVVDMPDVYFLEEVEKSSA